MNSGKFSNLAKQNVYRVFTSNAAVYYVPLSLIFVSLTMFDSMSMGSIVPQILAYGFIATSSFQRAKTL